MKTFLKTIFTSDLSLASALALFLGTAIVLSRIEDKLDTIQREIRRKL